ncbi:microtubule-associated TORTIFOLIA1 [Olea europaea subsp. europaea]|uniref:Microtubule-associated TORTIFOLIA1 n=1 Tax=Olea europaea subsp. europaea TaxID=158383 RepID=A0A8S0V5V0_OLEEU|nr:microtubule-associated TORTIFOLIA1 [Olea europaea subsp. europaea]
MGQCKFISRYIQWSQVRGRFTIHVQTFCIVHKVAKQLLKCLLFTDKDTHQIVVEDLKKIIQALSNDGVSMLLNCLHDAMNDPKPAVKKESIRLLAVLCTARTNFAATHLTKIVAHIVKRLKDSDSQVREACCDTVGSLSVLYLKGGGGNDGVASLFVKPLFEVIGENNKAV